MPLVLEPEIAAALELGPIFTLGSPNLVDGVVDELDGMELVERDLGFGQVVADALDEGAAHVDDHPRWGQPESQLRQIGAGNGRSGRRDGLLLNKEMGPQDRR